MFLWSSDDNPPTECPTNPAHEIDVSNATIMETIKKDTVEVSNLPSTPFDRLLCSQETVVIDCKPGMGLSDLRDRVRIEGDASVVNALNDPEYTLSCNGAGSAAVLRSSERGRYVSGLCSEVGIGGHLGSFPTGDQRVRFGSYDEASGNGYLFEIAADGLYACVMKDNIEHHRAHITQFNVDCMDGAGPSRLFLDPTRGYVWTIRFAWYGYGCVEFSVATENIDLKQHQVPLHRYYTRSRPSTSCPYLPVYASVESLTESSPIHVYVTGRKHAVLGAYNPDLRDVSASLELQIPRVETPSDQRGFTPLFALRRQERCSTVPIATAKIHSWTNSDSPCTIEVLSIPNATSSSVTDAWGPLDGIPASESALEVTRTASVLTSLLNDDPSDIRRISLWRCYAHALLKSDPFIANIAEDRTLIVSVSGLTASDAISVRLDLTECW